MKKEHPQGGPPWRVLVVDDHPMMRHGLAQFLGQERDLRVCGEAADAAQAMREISRLQPHLVVLDISMPGRNGLEVIKELRTRFPRVKVLIHSMYDENIYAERALRAGAKGYLMKQRGGEQLVSAAREVLDGRTYVSDSLAGVHRAENGNGRRRPQNSAARLSDRELEVLELIGTGSTNSEVAKHLHLSIKTVEAHREHIKRKLNLATSTALNLFAVRWVEAGRSVRR